MKKVNGGEFQNFERQMEEVTLVAAAKIQMGMIGQINGTVRRQLEMMLDVERNLQAQGVQLLPEARMIERIQDLLDETNQIALEMMLRIQTLDIF